MKKLVISLVVIGFSFGLLGQSTDKSYYLTTNILSPVAGLNKSVTAANVLVPLFSNLEYGPTLSGGLLQKHHAFEARLTYGKSNKYNVIPQAQVGWNFFITDYFKKNESGFYVGAFARYWMYRNTFSDTNLNNITSNLTIGYAWKKSKLIYDFRVNQPLTIYSKSNIEHTKPSFEANFSPMPEFLPILPFLSFNIGYKF